MTTMNKLRTFALTLLITGAIDSIRNLPASALFGSSLIFFFIFAAIFFLIPSALVSAELSANVDEGGVYQWASLAFNKRVGFLAVWLQWTNNLFWFPTILSFIAGTATYLINPALAENKYFMVGMILFLFWFLTLINLRGVRTSAKFTSVCAVIGLILPVILIIALLAAWITMGKPLQIQFNSASIFPSLQHMDNWMALTAVMLGFAGMELASVHIKDVNKPQRTFPKALGISTVIILITMMLGSLAIACVLPLDQINLVNGTIQTFAYFLSAYKLEWLTPIMTILLVLGSLGGTINWVISPIKGLNQAAQHGFMPAFFEQKNKYGVPQNLLIAQAILVSLTCSAFLLMPSVNASFWLLTTLTTQLYMLMYVILFLSGFRLRRKMNYTNNTFVIPGKNLGSRLVCLLGLMGCVITLFVGFIPPTYVNIGNPLEYQMLVAGGMIVMLLPIVFFYWYQNRTITALSMEAA